jgi:hypothetical protein
MTQEFDCDISCMDGVATPSLQKELHMTMMLETDELIVTSTSIELKLIIDNLATEVRAKSNAIQQVQDVDDLRMISKDLHDLAVDAERRARIVMYNEPDCEQLARDGDEGD